MGSSPPRPIQMYAEYDFLAPERSGTSSGRRLERGKLRVGAWSYTRIHSVAGAVRGAEGQG